MLNFLVRTSVVLLFALVWSASPLLAQDGPTPAGHWEGAIVVPGGELGIDVDLLDEEGAWKGDISIPAQQTQDFVLSDVIVKGTAKVVLYDVLRLPKRFNNGSLTVNEEALKGLLGSLPTKDES